MRKFLIFCLLSLPLMAVVPLSHEIATQELIKEIEFFNTLKANETIIASPLLLDLIDDLIQSGVLESDLKNSFSLYDTILLKKDDKPCDFLLSYLPQYRQAKSDAALREKLHP